MSQLSQLKQQINQLASAAEKAAQMLGGFDNQFTQQIQAVGATIGGSSQRKDQEVMQALQQASKQVKGSMQALGQASKVAKQYGASL